MTQISSPVFLLVFSLASFFCHSIYGADYSAPFRMSLSDLPKSLDPHRLRSSSGQFLSQQLFRNFYTYSSDNSYASELGEKCEKRKHKWICTIRAEAQWSDGKPITAEDFVLSYRRILKLPSPRADLLFPIKGAREVLEGKKTPDTLGVKAISEKTFEIEWNKDSTDQEVILMSPLFVPLPQGEFKKGIGSGPYVFESETNQKIVLKSNPLYFKIAKRPVIEFLVFEENMSVKAYEKGLIDFLRRVPTAQIPKVAKEKDFIWHPVLRMDSIAFGPPLQNDLQSRKALTESLEFSQIQSLLHSPEPFGCFGLPEDMAPETCFKGSQKLSLNGSPSVSFSYSTLGGDDHRRLAEWLQSQWLQNLKWNVKLQPLENKIFQERLERKEFQIFRRGLNLESPTCLNALEIYTTGHPENLSSFSNSQFDGLVKRLKLITQEKEKKRICGEALLVLKDQYAFIPTGRIHFAYRVNPKWKGWKLNRLNHLDLSDLKYLAN